MSRPEADAARRILAHTADPIADDRTRAMLETFYALVQLLPPGDETEFEAPEASRAERGADDAAPASDRRADRHLRTRRPRRRVVTLPVAALVAIVAALVFVTTLLFLPRGGFVAQDAVYLSGTGAARSARGIALAGSDETVIFASGLSELTPGYRYVAWRVDGEGYERIGPMVTLGTGRARLHAARVVDAEQIEITIEPSTSTGQPEGPTVLAGFRGLE